MSGLLRFWIVVGLGLSATAGPGWALQDDAGRVVTGEIEESAEMLPEQVIPWHDSLSELPEWMSREELEVVSGTRPANHGGGLFPMELWAQEPEPQQGPLIRDESLRLADGRGPRSAGEPAAVPLGPELLALYTGERPGRVFVDPQHLVARSEEQMESLVQRWLNEQCVFRTTVLVFGAGQQLPADFDPQALRNKWFGDSAEALLVFYFYGQPERTLAIFGGGARASYGESVLRGVVDAAVAEAGRVPGGAEQLERFCYKMSVRLHWLARTRNLAAAAGGGSGKSGASREAGSDANRRPWAVALLTAGVCLGGAMALALGILAWKKRRLAAAGGVDLAGTVSAEATGVVGAAPTAVPGKYEFPELTEGAETGLAMAASGSLAASPGVGPAAEVGVRDASAGEAGFWKKWAAGWKERRMRRLLKEEQTVIFPELEICPRLGAPHCGGFSAVVSFTPAADRVGGC